MKRERIVKGSEGSKIQEMKTRGAGERYENDIPEGSPEAKSGRPKCQTNSQPRRLFGGRIVGMARPRTYDWPSRRRSHSTAVAQLRTDTNWF